MANLVFLCYDCLRVLVFVVWETDGRMECGIKMMTERDFLVAVVLEAESMGKTEGL